MKLGLYQIIILDLYNNLLFLGTTKHYTLLFLGSTNENFFGGNFIIKKVDYADSVLNLYSEVESLQENYLSSAPQYICLSSYKAYLNKSVRAGGTLSIEGYWLKNISITNEISIIVSFSIFIFGRCHSGITNRASTYSNIGNGQLKKIQ